SPSERSRLRNSLSERSEQGVEAPAGFARGRRGTASPSSWLSIGPRLAGKVALISGIGSGQGRAAALLFARHRAKVVGCDLNRERAEGVAAEARAFAGELIALEANAIDEGDVERWVGEARSRFGRIDVLYNNAALGGFGMVHETPLRDWHWAIES